MKKLPPLRLIRQVYTVYVAIALHGTLILTVFSGQIDVAVNAPEAGTIKEFLANEEDTVTVGQDLVRLELGGAPKGGEVEKGAAEPEEPASKDQTTSSDPEPSKKEHSDSEDEPSSSQTQEKKPEPKKETPPPKQPEPKKADPKPASSAPALGSREERRVR